jgi:hypothetical protein
MEEVVGRQNLQRALKRVCANQGSPGVDGMTVDQLKTDLRIHWPEIRQRLLDGQYTPEPVKQVLIPKPDGSSRTLGIPTVVDRFIQQALLQALTPMYDPGFSDHSFGFRPGRNAHQAVRPACGKLPGAAEGISGRGALLATHAGQLQSGGSNHMESVSSDQAAESVTATKAIPPVPGVAGYRGAVNQFSKSVVREIRTLRSVRAGGG